MYVTRAYNIFILLTILVLTQCTGKDSGSSSTETHPADGDFVMGNKPYPGSNFYHKESLGFVTAVNINPEKTRALRLEIRPKSIIEKEEIAIERIRLTEDGKYLTIRGEIAVFERAFISPTTVSKPDFSLPNTTIETLCLSTPFSNQSFLSGTTYKELRIYRTGNYYELFLFNGTNGIPAIATNPKFQKVENVSTIIFASETSGNLTIHKGQSYAEDSTYFSSTVTWADISNMVCHLNTPPALTAPEPSPWLGTKRLGAPPLGGNEKITVTAGVARDILNNLFVAGHTTGSLDGNISGGGQEIFLKKYNPSGEKLWTKQLGALDQAALEVKGVATDAVGNAFVVGITNSRSFEGTDRIGGVDSFLTKYNGAGSKIWTRRIGVENFTVNARSVATDRSGNIFIGGETDGSLDGAIVGVPQDFFIAKYNPQGDLIWKRQNGATGKTTFGWAIATDSKGSVYITGQTYGGILGNFLAGMSDFFVAEYNSEGVRQPVRQMGVLGNYVTYGYSIAVDAEDNIIVAGDTNGPLDGNVPPITTSAFVTKFSPPGDRWTRLVKAAPFHYTVRGIAIATDALGNIYLTGTTEGSFDGQILHEGSPSFYLTKFDGLGNKVFTRIMDTLFGAWSTSIVADGKNGIFIGGYADRDLDGTTTIGNPDAFVCKYNSNGVKQ